MADTTFHNDLVVKNWQKDFFSEYIRNSRFNRYMGEDENKIFQLVKDLSKKRGDTVYVQLVTKLTGNGVTGDNTLRGNEESLDNYADGLTINQLRNAVSRGEFEQQKGNIDLLNAAKTALKNWAMERLRDDIIARMLSPCLDGITTYAAATETQKDAWLEANQDRVLFGDAKSNLDTTGGATGGADHSDSLVAIDGTTDVMDPENVSLAKRMARDADPHIRPIKVQEDEEWYVLFCNKWAFRDFKNSATYLANLRNAGPRSFKDNPLYTDGDLVSDGVILREIPEIGVVSNGTIDCAPNFLCGAQSVAVAWAKMTEAIKDEDDYGNVKGVGVREWRGVQKLFFNDKQHGMLTFYTAGVADA